MKSSDDQSSDVGRWGRRYCNAFLPRVGCLGAMMAAKNQSSSVGWGGATMSQRVLAQSGMVAMMAAKDQSSGVGWGGATILKWVLAQSGMDGGSDSGEGTVFWCC